MTIEANLIEGFKIGFGTGFFLGAFFGMAILWWVLKETE